jgi:hypothetical protein
MIADGVMAQQASDDWLTSTLHRSGFYFYPLGMGCWHVVLNRQTFPSMSFISQPTPSFGALRSTSGLSLFGMTPRWRKENPVGD